MIIANKYEVPDKCPEDCPFQGDTYAISQVDDFKKGFENES